MSTKGKWARWEKRMQHEAEERRERMTSTDEALLRKTGCEGKVRHPNGHDANVEASKLYQKRGWRVTAYCCSFCGFWHTGRDSRKPRADEPVPTIPLFGEDV